MSAPYGPRVAAVIDYATGLAVCAWPPCGADLATAGRTAATARYCGKTCRGRAKAKAQRQAARRARAWA